MNIQDFLKGIEAIYKTGAATEHSYRADLQKLLSSIAPDVTALNEPKRVKCGAPDFIVSQGDIVIGHVEAKDIPVGIRALKDSNKDQQKRYLAALPNLIYTNCLDWISTATASLWHRSALRISLWGFSPARRTSPPLKTCFGNSSRNALRRSQARVIWPSGWRARRT